MDGMDEMVAPSARGVNTASASKPCRLWLPAMSVLIACGGSPSDSAPAPSAQNMASDRLPGGGEPSSNAGAQTPAGSEGNVTPSGLIGGDSPPQGGASGEMPLEPCTASLLSAAVSDVIPTVGIVEFSTPLEALASARIEFGLDASYGLSAPVDLAAERYRTLLLGMKAGREYHYRIVAEGGGASCASADQTLTTGPLANDLPEVETTARESGAEASSFLMTGRYVRQGGGGGGGGRAPAYILDADGDFVWWYYIDADVTNARMSHDGKWMWISAANVPESQGANVHRVSMDGLIDEDLSEEFQGQNHHFTILPDETVAFFAYGDNGCDDVKERAPDGTVRTLINARDAHGAEGDCHLNFIEYSPDDNTLIFSDLDHDNITKITREGEVVWVLGGPTNDFTGAGASWSRQHGIDVLGTDRLVIFNNGGLGGDDEGSLALELELDLTGMTASIAWQYAAEPAIQNEVMGDVQRLANGNTVIAYSTQGVLHEVDPMGRLVRELTWGLGGAFGYAVQRPTLYGPPPR
jgi:hypothetical protein